MENKNTERISIINNFILLMKFINQIDKSSFFLIFMSIVFSAAIPFPSIIFSKQIINIFATDGMFSDAVKPILIMSILTFIIIFLNQIVKTKMEKKIKKLEYEAIMLLFQKMSFLDYSILNDADTMDKFNKATKCVMSMNFYILIISITNFFASIFSLIGVVAIIITINWLLLIIVFIIIVINAFSNSKLKKIQYRTDTELWPIDRKMVWFMRFLADASYAKDVRLLNNQKFIFKKYKNLSKKYHNLLSKIIDAKGKVKQTNNVLSFIQEVIIYLILGYQILVLKILTVGDFSMLYAAVSTFKTSCGGIIDGVVEMMNRGKYFGNYLEFMNIQSEFNNGRNISLTQVENHIDIIEFKNVSFKYPGQQSYAIKNINIKINNNEKLAVVGENGAGKTTFIKLLCRLYDPTEGEILYNGINIKDISYVEYLSLLSTIFQDYKLFSFTVKENMLFGEDYDEVELDNMIRGIGMEDTINNLPSKKDTLLYHDFDNLGVNLSGGQEQKIAILRCLLKKAAILILDEPTAALDPKAEESIYRNFSNITKNKTAIYISHRLASTKFCDRVAYFEGGQIIELDSHENLINKDGKYAQLFNTQAQYYR